MSTQKRKRTSEYHFLFASTSVFFSKIETKSEIIMYKFFIPSVGFFPHRKKHSENGSVFLCRSRICLKLCPLLDSILGEIIWVPPVIMGGRHLLSIIQIILTPSLYLFRSLIYLIFTSTPCVFFRLLQLCQRTMALPVGRGFFTLFSYQPVPTDPLPLPKLNLTGNFSVLMFNLHKMPCLQTGYGTYILR